MPNPRLDQLRIRQLKFIGLLTSRGSLAATAEELSMTPSAASMMLKEIEAIFGAKLFRRQGRGMVLTEAGQALWPRCQTVLGEVHAMKATVMGGSQPLLRMGAFPHTTATVLPQIVRDLTQSKPGWRLQIIEGSADQLLNDLQEGRIDLLLGKLPDTGVRTELLSELMQRVLYQSELAVVSSPKHPLASCASLSLAQLLDWPWILPSIHSSTRKAVANAFLKQGLTPPTPLVESPSFVYSLPLVAHTWMLTCCARSVAVLNCHQTSILPIQMGQESNPIALVWRKDSLEAQRAVACLDACVS